jgi:hypothetical protein
MELKGVYRISAGSADSLPQSTIAAIHAGGRPRRFSLSKLTDIAPYQAHGRLQQPGTISE